MSDTWDFGKNGSYKRIAVVGCQWGDEGKGKLIDCLAAKSDINARFGGGHNAGHDIVVNGVKCSVHLLPSGILHLNNTAVIGSGMVVHLKSLLKEIEVIQQHVPKIIERLRISTRAHLLFDAHEQIDNILEKKRTEISGSPIGTTLRGIGPCYTAKVSRIGLHVGELLDMPTFTKKYLTYMENLKHLYNIDIDTAEELARFEQYIQILRPCIVDTFALMHRSLNEDKKMLIEAANGCMLDIDFGTYPYVTSSTTHIGGITTGLGIPNKHIQVVIGVFKAYLTRVGSGPFPTELKEDMANTLRNQGAEFGVSTGRPRRCGWIDIPMIRYATRLNDFTCFNMTKLDILSGFNPIKICVAYRNKKTLEEYDEYYYPSTIEAFDEIEPIYEDCPGWDTNISKCTTYAELPENAKRYIQRIEELVQRRVWWIGVGPERTNTICNW